MFPFLPSQLVSWTLKYSRGYAICLPVLQVSLNLRGLPWLPWAGWVRSCFPQSFLDAYFVFLCMAYGPFWVIGSWLWCWDVNHLLLIGKHHPGSQRWKLTLGGSGAVSQDHGRCQSLKDQVKQESIGRPRSKYQAACGWTWHLGGPRQGYESGPQNPEFGVWGLKWKWKKIGVKARTGRRKTPEQLFFNHSCCV